MTAPLLIGLSLVEAVVPGRRARRGGAPFAWHETWLSLADMAGPHVAGLVPLTRAGATPYTRGALPCATVFHGERK